MIGQQLSLVGLSDDLYMTRYALGMAGETLVARYLELAGYPCDVGHKKGWGDLTAYPRGRSPLSIEVKTDREGLDGSWRFTLVKHWQGRWCADHRNCHYVIAVAVLATGQGVPFVIPAYALEGIRAFAISSHPMQYAGKWAGYRQRLNSLSLEV